MTKIVCSLICFFWKGGNVQFPSVSSGPCFSVLISNSTSQDELAVFADFALMHSGERSQELGRILYKSVPRGDAELNWKYI